MNLTKLGRISLLETTRMTGGATSAPFDVARAAPQAVNLEARRDEILGVTDVRAARENRILPLPSRAVGIDGEVTVVEYRPSDRVLETFVAGQRDALGRTVAPPRVAQWKNALLDLSLRNRLINFTSSAGYQLAVPGAALGRFEDMINAGSERHAARVRRRAEDRSGARHPPRSRPRLERARSAPGRQEAGAPDRRHASDLHDEVARSGRESEDGHRRDRREQLYLAFGTCVGSSTTGSCNRRWFSCR